MAKRSRALQIECDAPSYAIVKACQRLGFYAPEDVRWCRLSHHSRQRPDWRQLFRQPLRFFREMARSNSRTCFCGQALPALEMCTFTLISGKELPYFMGQCSRCHAIFWDESPSLIEERGHVS